MKVFTALCNTLSKESEGVRLGEGWKGLTR